MIFAIRLRLKQRCYMHPHYAEYWDLLAQVNEWGIYILGYEEHEVALLEAKSNIYVRPN